MGAAVVNPAFVPLGQAFHITPVQASYELTVFIICAGVGPLFVVPLSNIYGRRPIYLLGNLLAAVTNIIAGNCTTWAGLLATRAFNGIGAGSPVAIGAATICDLYFLHERGFYMGIYTFFHNNGAHIAPLIGGFIAQSLGWRWCFNIPVWNAQGPPFPTEVIFFINCSCSNAKSRLSGLHTVRCVRGNAPLPTRDFVLPPTRVRIDSHPRAVPSGSTAVSPPPSSLSAA